MRLKFLWLFLAVPVAVPLLVCAGCFDDPAGPARQGGVAAAFLRVGQRHDNALTDGKRVATESFQTKNRRPTGLILRQCEPVLGC